MFKFRDSELSSLRKVHKDKNISFNCLLGQIQVSRYSTRRKSEESPQDVWRKERRNWCDWPVTSNQLTWWRYSRPVKKKMKDENRIENGRSSAIIGPSPSPSRPILPPSLHTCLSPHRCQSGQPQSRPRRLPHHSLRPWYCSLAGSNHVLSSSMTEKAKRALM